MVAQPLAVVLTVGATAVVMGFATGPVLRRLPEPLDGDGKTTYRDLATTRFILGCVLLSALAQVLALASEPVRTLPLWTVLATAGVLLAAIDGRTTWLPLTLTRLAWTLMAAAVLLAVALGGSPATLLRTLLGAGAAGGLYLLVWAVSRGGFGFGDVRFAPLLGAATAAHSWTLLIWALTLGTALGALHGMTRLLRRLQGGFPYAPSMLGGSYLAAVALAVFSDGRSP